MFGTFVPVEKIEVQRSNLFPQSQIKKLHAFEIRERLILEVIRYF